MNVFFSGVFFLPILLQHLNIPVMQKPDLIRWPILNLNPLFGFVPKRVDIPMARYKLLRGFRVKFRHSKTHRLICLNI